MKHKKYTIMVNVISAQTKPETFDKLYKAFQDYSRYLNPYRYLIHLNSLRRFNLKINIFYFVT